MKRINRFLKPISALLIAALLSGLSAFGAAAIEPPEIESSQTALVYCVESGTILYENGIDNEIFPAALVKLMTALVAYENAEAAGLTMESKVTVSRRVINATVGNKVPLYYGEELSLQDLMGAMVLSGANDAALAIAEAVGGSFEDFVDMMNAKAAELGMTHTVYRNATGIHHNEMVTTPRDLLILASYVNRIPYLADLCAMPRITVEATNRSEVRYIGTRNYLISDRVSTDYYLPMANGMICGSTAEAGYCAIATGQHDGLNFIAIITGAGSTMVLASEAYTYPDGNGNEIYVPEQYKVRLDGLVEAGRLLTWADRNFRYIRAVDRSTPIVEVPVRLARDIDSVTLMPETPLELFVPNDIDRAVDLSLDWTLENEILEAPIKAGQRVGTLTVSYRGEKIGRVPLVVRNNIERSGGLTVFYRLKTLAETPFFLVAIALTAFAAVFYIFSTAASRQKKKKTALREYEKKTRYLK